MPHYDRAELGRVATGNGFTRDTFEKVLRLKELLFEDAEIIGRIKNHPMALWKCRTR